MTTGFQLFYRHGYGRLVYLSLIKFKNRSAAHITISLITSPVINKIEQDKNIQWNILVKIINR